MKNASINTGGGRRNKEARRHSKQQKREQKQKRLNPPPVRFGGDTGLIEDEANDERK